MTVHFLNCNKRHDRAVDMSEVKAWKMDHIKENEYKRPHIVGSPTRISGTAALVAPTPNSPRPMDGELRKGVGVLDATQKQGAGSEVEKESREKCGTCSCRVDAASYLAYRACESFSF